MIYSWFGYYSTAIFSNEQWSSSFLLLCFCFLMFRGKIHTLKDPSDDVAATPNISYCYSKSNIEPVLPVEPI